MHFLMSDQPVEMFTLHIYVHICGNGEVFIRFFPKVNYRGMLFKKKLILQYDPQELITSKNESTSVPST